MFYLFYTKLDFKTLNLAYIYNFSFLILHQHDHDTNSSASAGNLDRNAVSIVNLAVRSHERTVAQVTGNLGVVLDNSPNSLNFQKHILQTCKLWFYHIRDMQHNNHDNCLNHKHDKRQPTCKSGWLTCSAEMLKISTLHKFK